MTIELTISNFLGIKSSQTISFVAGERKFWEKGEVKRGNSDAPFLYNRIGIFGTHLPPIQEALYVLHTILDDRVYEDEFIWGLFDDDETRLATIEVAFLKNNEAYIYSVTLGRNGIYEESISGSEKRRYGDPIKKSEMGLDNSFLTHSSIEISKYPFLMSRFTDPYQVYISDLKGGEIRVCSLGEFEGLKKGDNLFRMYRSGRFYV